jgi:hypothetical protein
LHNTKWVEIKNPTLTFHLTLSQTCFVTPQKMPNATQVQEEYDDSIQPIQRPVSLVSVVDTGTVNTIKQASMRL